MRTKIEAVLNNKDAKAQDYFDLVNIYEFSQVTLQRDGESILSMDINEVNTLADKTFEFREKCISIHYTVEESNIASVTGRMLDDMDTFLIEADLKDGGKLAVVIYHVDTNEKREVSESYYESDVFSLMDYLNEEDHKVMMAIIHDSFGLEIKMNSVIGGDGYGENDEVYQKLKKEYPHLGFSTGGVIGQLNKVATDNGDDGWITVQAKERVLTARQNNLWEKWTKNLPELVNISDYLPSIISF